MILIIFLILLLFSVLFAYIWLWFFKPEKASSKTLYKKGKKALKKQDYLAAKDLFSEIFLIEPNFQDVEYLLGICLQELGEYDNAKICFENILKNSPKNIQALLSMAQTLIKQEKDDEAQEFYNRVLEEDSENTICYLNLGLIQYRKQDYNAALEFFEKIKEKSEQYELAFIHIVMCKSQMCKFDDEKEYQNILNECTKLSKKKNLPKEFYNALINLYARAGKIKEAAALCKKVMMLDAENFEAYKILGLIQVIKKDFGEAKNTLSTAIHLQPKDEDLYEILSYIMCRQEDDSERQICREKYYEIVKKFI